MNKVERMRAVLAGEIADRVPASFWFHFPEDQAHGEASVKAHLDYYRQADLDFLKIMNEHPYQVETRIKNPIDWRKLKPAPLSSDYYQAPAGRNQDDHRPAWRGMPDSDHHL
jgi:uroporphyrinogen decarboxylase